MAPPPTTSLAAVLPNHDNLIKPVTDATEDALKGYIYAVRADLGRVISQLTLLPTIIREAGEKLSFEQMNALYFLAFEHRVDVDGVKAARAVPATAFLDLIVPKGPKLPNSCSRTETQTGPEYLAQVLTNSCFNGAVPVHGLLKFWAPKREDEQERHATLTTLDGLITGGTEAVPNRSISGQHALEFLTAIAERANHCGTKRYRGYLASRLIEAIVAYTELGVATTKKIEKVTSTFDYNEDLVLNMDTEHFNPRWTLINNIIANVDVSINAIFSNMKALFTPEISLRLTLVIQQARGGGMAPIHIVTKAMAQFPKWSGWQILRVKEPEQWKAVLVASRLAAREPLASFDTRNPKTELRGTLFPDFVATAKMFLINVANETTLRQYQGQFKTTHQTIIEKAIEDYKTEQTSDADIASYKFGGNNHQAMNIVFPDLQNIQKANDEVGL